MCSYVEYKRIFNRPEIEVSANSIMLSYCCEVVHKGLTIEKKIVDYGSQPEECHYNYDVRQLVNRYHIP